MIIWPGDVDLIISWPIVLGFMFVIKFLTTCNATSASSKAKRISFKPESTCSSVQEGALLSLENIFSNLFVKFSNIFKYPTPIALVGEPSLTSVDTLV